MKICYIADTIVPSRKANSIHVMRMCQAYSRLGHDVTLVLPGWRHNVEPGIHDVYEYYGLDRKFKILKVPFPGFSSTKFVHRSLFMPLFAMFGRPDLCHTRSISSAWGLTRILGIPSILEIHRLPDDHDRTSTMFEHIVESQNLTLLVVLSNALANEIRPILPEATPLAVAHDGVDSSWLANTMTREEARKKLNLDKRFSKIAAYAGHLYAGRGIELILEVAAALPDYLFVIVGGRNEELEIYREKTRSSANINLVGFKPPKEMLLYLKAADALLMPYATQVGVTRGGKGGDTSAFMSPMKMFEYMAAGRPILASSSPVLQEVLQHESNALLLPFDQPLVWRNALLNLAQKPELGDRLGQLARNQVTQYTWEARCQHLLEQVTAAKKSYLSKTNRNIQSREK